MHTLQPSENDVHLNLTLCQSLLIRACPPTPHIISTDSHITSHVP